MADALIRPYGPGPVTSCGVGPRRTALAPAALAPAALDRAALRRAALGRASVSDNRHSNVYYWEFDMDTDQPDRSAAYAEAMGVFDAAG